MVLRGQNKGAYIVFLFQRKFHDCASNELLKVKTPMWWNALTRNVTFFQLVIDFL